MKFLSVCAGIDAASVAWTPLGWECIAHSEIEPFPCAVLAHRYPSVPNWGDMTKFKEWPDAAIDVLVGGTPCQSFSVAGLRKGLADPRGNLMLTYLAIADRYRPQWVVWENVPGVLSSNGGRDFGTFLGGLGELGYGFSYRVLDAQYVRVESHPRAVPQRRRRVFVVGCAGGWRRAAAVLFERESLLGHPPPSRKTGQGVAPTISARTRGGGGLGTDFDCDGGLTLGVCGTLSDGAHNGGGSTVRTPTPDALSPCVAMCLNAGAMGRQDAESETLIPTIGAVFDDAPIAFAQNQRDEVRVMNVAGALAAEPGMKQQTYVATLAIRGRDGHSELELREDGTANAILTPSGGRGGIGVGAIAFDARQSDVIQYGEKTGPLDTDGHSMAVAFTASEQANGFAWERNYAPCLNAQVPNDTRNIQTGARIGMQVRRLTPLECSRLQGFPDNYLDITFRGKPAADGNRYKALGNSFAVNVVRWIGERIQSVNEIAYGENTRTGA